jgi:hypothetical protein
MIGEGKGKTERNCNACHRIRVYLRGLVTKAIGFIMPNAYGILEIIFNSASMYVIYIHDHMYSVNSCLIFIMYV